MSSNIKIPKRLRFYSKPEQDIKHPNGYDAVVYNTFAVDINNMNTNETARIWAEGYRKLKPLIHEFDNKPINDVKLYDLEKRGQGGRAYKVLIYDQFVFDLREDTLLEILMYHKIEKGIISCPLIFAVIGNQMKLIVENGKKHLEFMDQKETPLENNFQPGSLLKNKLGHQLIFLGEVISSADIWININIWKREKKKKYFQGYLVAYLKNSVIENFSDIINYNPKLEIVKKISPKIFVRKIDLPNDFLKILKDSIIENLKNGNIKEKDSYYQIVSNLKFINQNHGNN